jgi:Raf kinase inhibitor-like YbhB/YbcL family protein
VLFNLPAATQELPEGTPASATLAHGAKQGKNDFGKIGYGGPAPPPGKPHRYYFKLYALDTTLNLQPSSKKTDLQNAMKGHTLADAQMMGRYKRAR